MSGILKKTASTGGRLGGGVLVAAMVWMLPAPSFSQQGELAGKPSVQAPQVVYQKKTPVSLKLHSKVENFLEKTLTATSLEEIRKSFEEETFTEQDLALLESRIQQQPYKGKLDELERHADEGQKAALQKQAKQGADKRINRQALRQQQQLTAMNLEMEVRLRAHGRQLAVQESELAPADRPKPPKIVSLSSEDITPGQILEINGNHFGALKGRVSFLISGRTFDGLVKYWRDGSIQVAFPSDVSGLPQVIGKVEVKNSAKMMDSKTIQFMPTMDHRDLSSWCSMTAFSIFGDGNSKVLLGKYQLINGWHVAEVWLDVDTSGKAGAYYKEMPPIGGASPRATVRIWVDAFSSVKAVHNVIVEGPKGLKPYTKTN